MAVAATGKKAKPRVEIQRGDYFTDGTSLVRVVWVDDHEQTVELENAASPDDKLLAITAADLRKNWEKVVPARLAEED